MDKKYQDIRYQDRHHRDPLIIRKVTITRINFSEDYITIIANDDTGKQFYLSLAKSRGSKLIID